MFGDRKFWSLVALPRQNSAWGAPKQNALRLEPKAASVLAVLREADGATVSRGTLLDRCWAPGHGSDEALTQAVAQLRRVLKDDRARPRFVATVPRIGYRWIAEDTALTPTNSEKTMRPRRLASRILIGFGLLAAGGLATSLVSEQLWPAKKLQITTEVRLGKDGQRQVVTKSVER